MSEFVVSAPPSIPEQNNKTSVLEAISASLSESTKPVACHLQLVVSNPEPFSFQDKILSSESRNFQILEDRSPFSCSLYKKSASEYVMTAKDPYHYLECDLTLNVVGADAENNAPPLVVCEFSAISDEELDDFIWEDETLLGTILIQYQMRILEKLLTFCANHDAARLHLIIDEEESEKFGIYEDFICYETTFLSQETKKKMMTIPIEAKTFDGWLEFMENAHKKLIQALWADQRANPAIRHYLQSNPFIKIYG
jgi:hypothetical protein